MKVLMIGNDPSVHGGITSVINQLLAHDWEKQNIKMDFIPTYESGNTLHKIHFFLKSKRKIKLYLKNEKPSIVHIHMSYKGSFIRKYNIHKMCKKYGIQDVIHLHGSEFEKFYNNSSNRRKKDIQLLFEECSSVIVLGDKWSKFIKQVATKAKVITINNTVSIPDAVVNQEVNEINILFLGVLIKRKGVMDFLKSIDMLKINNVLENKKVTFNIGGTGDQEGVLKAYVDEHNLNKYVKFLGWVNGEEKERHLQDNQILVLPSYNEGLPISILEGLSYGMPIVATDVGSVSEAVINGVNGYLFTPGDIQAMYNGLKNMILYDNLRRKMSKESRNLAEKVFNDKKYFESIERCYKTN